MCLSRDSVCNVKSMEKTYTVFGNCLKWIDFSCWIRVKWWRGVLICFTTVNFLLAIASLKYHTVYHKCGQHYLFNIERYDFKIWFYVLGFSRLEV